MPPDTPKTSEVWDRCPSSCNTCSHARARARGEIWASPLCMTVSVAGALQLLVDGHGTTGVPICIAAACVPWSRKPPQDKENSRATRCIWSKRKLAKEKEATSRASNTMDSEETSNGPASPACSRVGILERLTPTVPGHREDAHVRHAKDKNRIPGMFCMHNATWTMHVQGLVMVRKRWRTCMHVRQGAGTAESGAAGLCIPNRSYHRSCLFSFGRMVELF